MKNSCSHYLKKGAVAEETVRECKSLVSIRRCLEKTSFLVLSLDFLDVTESEFEEVQKQN